MNYFRNLPIRDEFIFEGLFSSFARKPFKPHFSFLKMACRPKRVSINGTASKVHDEGGEQRVNLLAFRF